MAIETLGSGQRGWASDYFSEPAHAGWAFRYMGGRNGGFLLAFAATWKAKFLPPGIGEKPYQHGEHTLLCVLLDTQTGKLHQTKVAPAYDNEGARLELGGVMDAEWDEVDPALYRSLQSYFYLCHHCPCHRKQDLRDQCGLVLDDECAGDRFKIERIAPAFNPDLILLSEVHADHELEDFLQAGNPTEKPDAA